MRSTPVAVICGAVVLSSIAVASAQESPAALMEQGHWKRVRAIAQGRLKASADDPEGNFLMGNVQLKWGDTNAALPYAEKAVKLVPQNAEYHWLLAQVVGDMAEKASVFRQIGLARRFRSEAETVLSLDPKHVEAHYGMMIYYFKAPGIVGGDKKKAYAEVEAIRKIDRAKGCLAEVRLAREEKQTGKIEDLYKQAVAANPKEYDAIVGLLNIAINARNLTAVEAHARAAVAASPTRTSGYSGLAWLAVTQKNWSELDNVLASAEKAIPDDYSPYVYAAAGLLRDNEDMPRAERYLRKFLTQEREPGTWSDAAVHWRLGLVLEKAGRKPEAITELETAVRLDASFEAAKKDLKRLKG